MQDTYRRKPSPEEFELVVKYYLESASAGLRQFHAVHRENLQGVDGTYEVDVSARFEALGVKFLVLIECKCQNSPIKREVVQILRDRMQATGAHKGMIFATTSFQKGAVKYAETHGIALITVGDVMTIYSAALGPPSILTQSPWANYPGDTGWVSFPPELREKLHSLTDVDQLKLLRVFLDIQGKDPPNLTLIRPPEVKR
jgi:restriction system protein